MTNDERSLINALNRGVPFHVNKTAKHDEAIASKTMRRAAEVIARLIRYRTQLQNEIDRLRRQRRATLHRADSPAITSSSSWGMHRKETE